MKVEVAVVPNSPSGLCGRKATLNLKAARQKKIAIVLSERTSVFAASVDV